MSSTAVPTRVAFTLVEVLVTLAIVATLLALILPAVSQVRKAARQTECQNRLHQFGTAVQSFEASHRHYPGNGWGYLWIGDPDRGVGPKQPGGVDLSTAPLRRGSRRARSGEGA